MKWKNSKQSQLCQPTSKRYKIIVVHHANSGEYVPKGTYSLKKVAQFYINYSQVFKGYASLQEIFRCPYWTSLRKS